MYSFYKSFLPLLISFFFYSNCFAQAGKNVNTDTAKFITAPAGPQYKRSKWHQFLWGKNYRKECAKPVKLPVLLLPDAKGGLTPDKEGGGHQTTSLHMKSADGKNYSIRSIDKKLGKVLPKIFLGTFIEKTVNDEVSMSNPYAAVTVTGMAKAAGIYHTTPQLVYVPRQPGLDSFNNKFGNKVYLFEERVKGNWSSEENLGRFEDFKSTEDILKKLQKNTNDQVDEKSYIKARLFDMFLGDWDRHEDQWNWGTRDSGDRKIYVPIPVDRDQVYFKHNGLILDAAIYASGIRYFQSFKNHITNVDDMNYEERGTDRVFTTSLTKEDWINAATQLQQALTDEVIESSVKKFPPEIFALSGMQIIQDLKSRRNLLKNYALRYYLFINKEVEITGTEGAEYFAVKRINDSSTQVNIYNITKQGDTEKDPYYSRTFFSSETKEIRLFGISGNDVFTVEGDADKAITLRIIGGYDKDSIEVRTNNGHRAKVFIYDGHTDVINGKNIKQRLSGDSAIHEYVYRDYLYDQHFSYLRPLYSDEDRIYVGFGYLWKHFRWRKLPFDFFQNINIHYSITQNAISTSYGGIFPNTIGKWNLSFITSYDFIRWTNFYGLGNETILTTKNLDFNRMRSREFNGALSLFRKAGNNFFRVSASLRSLAIVNDPARYIAKTVAFADSSVYNWKTFATASAVYGFSKLNDAITPTAGIALSANGSFTQNINTSSQSFWQYGGNLRLYIPLCYKFSLALSGGAQTVTGNPEFYQYPEIGGGQDLRGFQRQRFYGKTAFYNSNELRFISNVHSYLYNGKAGVFAFVDDGRVWMPGEKSNTLHVGYGGGIIVVPFNFIYAEATYGFSNEDQLIQFRLNLPL